MFSFSFLIDYIRFLCDPISTKHPDINFLTKSDLYNELWVGGKRCYSPIFPLEIFSNLSTFLE